MRNGVRAQVLFLVALLAASALRAETASLVADLSPQADPSGESGLPSELFAFRGKLLFSATAPGSGRELWVSDGQGRGTYLLADLCVGFCDANPRILGVTASAVVGEARTNYETFTYLWRSDGTREGTFLLPSGSDPARVKDGSATVLLGQVLYFSGCNAEQGCGLWRSDGTPAGTRAVQVFAGTAGVSGLAASGNRLFFLRDRMLWVTDGTAAGTREVRELPAMARLATGLGNRVAFVSGGELWVSDGTTAGTRALTSFAPADPFQQTFFLEPLGGKLYFVADDGVHGAEIWTTDGTPKGTRQVTEIGFPNPFAAAGTAGLRATDLDLLGNRLVVWATDGVRGFQPWTSTGTPASTKPLCPTCSFTNERAALVKVGSRLVFTGREARHGAEVWATDGTPKGTVLLKDICSGSCDGAVSEPQALRGSAFFAASGPGAGGLWTSDGTARGTRRFAVADPHVDAGGSLGRLGLAALGSTVFYAGDGPDDDYGVELWASDGTPASSRLVTDAARGNASSIFTAATAVGRNLFFILSDQTAPYQQSLWFTQGTAEGTRRADRQLGHDPFLGASVGGALLLALHDEELNREQVWRVDPDTTLTQLTQIPPDVRIDDWDVLGDRLYFIPQDERDGSTLPLEIWRSDGTVQGTVKTAELPADLYFTSYFTSVGTEICFVGYNLNGGTEIWRTDGTQAGTRKLADFAEVIQLDPEFTRVGSTLFFAGVGEGGRQIWKTDGTPEGTAKVTDLDPDPDAPSTEAVPTGLTAFQGSLYFTARTPQGRRGLWRTEGTPQSTILLKDFVETLGNGYTRNPSDLTAVGSWLVFAADDGVHGKALWRSDGTAAGTTLLRELVTGSFVPAAGRLYFSAHDGIHGFELWQTDGTADGTRLVQDLAPGGASSFPGYLTVAEDRLFFAADDGISGQELWVLPLSGLSCQPSDTALCLAGGRFEVKVSWRDFAGEKGSGHAVPLSADTGYFWFFDPANVETAVKVLDGTPVNGHFWVFFGALTNVEYTLTVTDTRTGLTRRYFNPKGVFASVGDTQGFGPLGAYSTERRTAASPPPVVTERTDAAAATGTCVPAAGRLCLNGGRFAVEASWKDFSNQTGAGTAVSLTGDTGYFWFFDSSNVEVVIKVLDGTPVNGHFWVYYGALSNVEYTLTVTDTVTGHVKSYRNPPGRFASAGDTSAF